MDRNRTINLILVRVQPHWRRLGSAGGDQDRDERDRMACLMKILQIQSIIPLLIQRCAVKGLFPDLELNNKHHGSNQEHCINAPPHSWNVKLQKDGAWHAIETSLEKADLCEPGIPLCWEQREVTVAGKPPNDRIRVGLEKLTYGSRIPGPRQRGCGADDLVRC